MILNILIFVLVAKYITGMWNNLPKPFFVLAPMADVTDAAFRSIITKYGKPDLLYTEFVSADGLFLGGYDALIKDLSFTEKERPIVAQFFTSNPETMEKAAKLAKELGFDGVDINMGCPDRSVEKQGAGSALMKSPKLAQEIIYAAKKGGLPVSVKIRIGYNKNELDEWLPNILETEPEAVIVHARTRKEMSKVPADWAQVKRAVEIRDSINSKSLIVGNGDVLSVVDGREKIKETGCDGVMIGRGIFGNPWLFSEKQVSIEEKLKVMVEHTKLFKDLYGDSKNFAIMKKHYKAYVSDFDGAKELRIKLMEAKTAEEVSTVVNNFIEHDLT